MIFMIIYKKCQFFTVNLLFAVKALTIFSFFDILHIKEIEAVNNISKGGIL
jgi:phosphatidylglycerophosphatase A